MLRLKWCVNKVWFKIHAYGWGVGTFNQHLIFMMDVVNIDTSPTSGDVLKSCAFYQSLRIHTSFMHQSQTFWRLPLFFNISHGHRGLWVHFTRH